MDTCHHNLFNLGRTQCHITTSVLWVSDVSAFYRPLHHHWSRSVCMKDTYLRLAGCLRTMANSHAVNVYLHRCGVETTSVGALLTWWW